MAAVAVGCQSAPKATFSSDKPSQHAVRRDHFVIHSDVRLETDDSVIRELEDLQQQITSTLQLPPQRDPVVVYLFSDEVTYRFYMQTTWSNLPPRRAYFVGTPRELAVYSFRSPQLQEDLRHEFTHGVLHACLKEVPLWLDEGLAEYFEVRGSSPGGASQQHLRELRTSAEGEWRPNLFQLEMIHDFRDLTPRGYAESWAWIHFLLHHDPTTRLILLDYLTELQTATTPRRLLPTLEKKVPTYYAAVRNHVRQLQSVQLPASQQTQ